MSLAAALVAVPSASAAPVHDRSVASGPARTVSAHRLPHTRKKVVRPVHRNGRPVKGWKVVNESHGHYFTCEIQSPVSVSAHVDWCGSTADNTIACWKSRHHTVLCLRDPRVHTLVRIRYYGAFPLHRVVRHPSPETLSLRKHGYCYVRLGGAWDWIKAHPSWVGFYWCTTKTNKASAVYAPRHVRDGIYRSVNPWRVHLLTYRGGYAPANQVIVNDRVRTAYYVGTAK